MSKEFNELFDEHVAGGNDDILCDRKIMMSADPMYTINKLKDRIKEQESKIAELEKQLEAVKSRANTMINMARENEGDHYACIAACEEIAKFEKEIMNDS